MRRREKYKRQFPAHELVRTHYRALDRDLEKQYDLCCYYVHPSLYSVVERIGRTDEEQYALISHEVRATERKERLELTSNHTTLVSILGTLAVRLNSEADFDAAQWNAAVQEFEPGFQDVCKQVPLHE